MKSSMFQGAFCAIFALAAAVFGTSALASPLPAVTDTYEGTYFAKAYNNTGGGHALWLPGLLSDTDWKFQNGSGRFSYPTYGSGAALTGQIVNDNGAGYFDVSIAFSFLQKGGNPGSAPKCELGAHCSTLTYDNPDNVSGYSDNFEYFHMVAGQATLTGQGSLAGLNISLSQRPADLRYPLQVGYSADNKNENEFGGSVWFFWTVTQNSNNYTISNTSGNGDVNILLSPVPLPAGLPLLLAALGVFGVLRIRRKAV